MNKAQFPTSKLAEKYGIVKSVLYNRLNALYIKPQRQGNKSFISSEELTLMNELDVHLKAGRGIEEFVKLCFESGRIVSVPQDAIITQTQAQAMTTQQPPEGEIVLGLKGDAEEAVEHLVHQKDAAVNAADLIETDAKSQNRAAAKAIGEETLTLYYEATEAFTIPELKQQFEQHRSKIKQIRARRTIGMGQELNDFLSQNLPAQMATGTNVPPSPNGGKKPLGESSTNGSKNGFSPNEPKNNGGLSSP